MSHEKSILDELIEEIRAFAQVRDWEQYHTPKNLTMALAGEAGELVAELQWLTPGEASPDALTPDKKEALMMEMADVQIYLLRLADVLGVDVAEAVRKKLAINKKRF